MKHSVEEIVRERERELEARRKKVDDNHQHLRQAAKTVKVIASLASIDDASYIVISDGWESTYTIEIWLYESRKGTPLVRELALALGCNLNKSPAYNTIRVDGKLDDGGKISIYGYLPTSCHVEYEEIIVPERIERRPKVVCPSTETEAEEVTP